MMKSSTVWVDSAISSFGPWRRCSIVRYRRYLPHSRLALNQISPCHGRISWEAGSSSNYVRHDVVGEAGDLILQPQLALFQPGQLHLIGGSRFAHRGELGIEPAMLGAQIGQALLA